MANVTHYDPFDLLDGVVKSVLRPGYEAALSRQRNGWSGAATIPIDVIENNSQYVVWADLPGVRKEDLNVSIMGSQLALSAEIKRENAVEQKGQGKDAVLWHERPTGTLTRQLQFGADIEESKVDAQLRDGVLRLTLPKKESAQVKRIAIQ